MTKKCSRCQTFKSYEFFHNDKSTKDGKAWNCKECVMQHHREYYFDRNGKAKKKIANRFLITGFTQEDYEQKLKEQDGKCAICKTDNPGKTDWHSDHCHDTGQKRGLLCKNCNTGIGLLKDDIELLKAAIEYLEHYKALQKDEL